MKEYEKYLKEIYDDFKNQKAAKIKIVCRDSMQKANIDYLIENDLVKSTGKQNWVDGSTHYFLLPTYKGLHYDELKNEMSEKQVQIISNAYYNYEGKMNINSVDNSNNVNNDVEILDKMIQAIKDSNIQNYETIVKMIEELKIYKGKPELKDKVSSFLQNTANCATIISPFVPYLIDMLH